jgi:periplasmic copper chaperone A
MKGDPMKIHGVLAAGLLILSASVANAASYKLGSLEIDDPWSPATPRGATVAAGYMKIRNTGAEPDRLTGITSPIAGKLEIHQMAMDKGVMTMRPLPSGLEIKPGATVELKPSSFHLMIMGLKQPVEKGKPFTVSLTFEKAGAVDVEFTVEPLGATAPTAPARNSSPDTHQH